jgi:hypothetical protein
MVYSVTLRVTTRLSAAQWLLPLLEYFLVTGQDIFWADHKYEEGRVCN